MFRFRSWEPSAPESAIRADRCTGRTLSRYSQVVLGGKQLTIRIEYVGKSDNTGGVGLLRAVAHALQFSNFTQDFVAAILRLDKQTEGVFDIFGRMQHGASILDQGFGIGASRFLDFCRDAAEIEESPAQTDDTDRLKSLLLEEVGGRQRFRPDDARKRELRIIIRKSLANVSVRGSDRPLGSDDVRPSA